MSATGLFWWFGSWMFEWPDFEVVKRWLLGVSGLISAAYTFTLFVKENRSVTEQNGYFQRVDEDIKNGFVVIERLEVYEVVEVEEYDDEGAGFLLALRDGRVLFLIGQHLYPFSLAAEAEERAEVENEIFPSDIVAVTYAPRSGIILASKGVGAYLRPRGWLRWQGKGPRSSYYEGPLPDSFEDGPLDAVIERAGFIEEAV